MTIRDMFNGLNRNIDWNPFVKTLCSVANEHVQLQKPNKIFQLDDNNIDIIRNLYLYTIGHDKCQWNLDKGIFMGGKIGAGKTTLMKAYTKTLGMATGYNIECFQAPSLYIHLNKYGMESLKKRPIFIDELGREQLEIYLDGARVRPIEDLVAMRYEYGALTFFTSNFKLSTLGKGFDEKGKKIGYGEYCAERIADMCNIVVLPGGSRRDQNPESNQK